MKLTEQQKQRVRNGDVSLLKTLLASELEDIKTQLLVYRPEKSEYDNVLKGRGSLASEILTLLGN